MDAMIVVDMQAGLLIGAPKHDLQGVLQRINRLTNMIRGRSGRVVRIQHCGPVGDDFEPNTPGWEFLPELDHQRHDVVVHKTLNDPFVRTDLQAVLTEIAPDRVLIAGWATDFCVDATVRSAVSNNHNVVVVGDAHTLSDRPHLDAPTVICHHNWVWANLITNQSTRIASAVDLLGDN